MLFLLVLSLLLFVIPRQIFCLLRVIFLMHFRLFYCNPLLFLIVSFNLDFLSHPNYVIKLHFVATTLFWLIVFLVILESFAYQFLFSLVSAFIFSATFCSCCMISWHRIFTFFLLLYPCICNWIKYAIWASHEFTEVEILVLG